jgi:hypothetical protein
MQIPAEIKLSAKAGDELQRALNLPVLSAVIAHLSSHMVAGRNEITTAFARNHHSSSTGFDPISIALYTHASHAVWTKSTSAKT